MRELTAVIEGMKLEHEVAMSRMEGELKYRNTQASAATSSLQKQLGEAEEEMASLRRQLAAAEGRIHNMSATVSRCSRWTWLLLPLCARIKKSANAFGCGPLHCHVGCRAQCFVTPRAPDTYCCVCRAACRSRSCGVRCRT